MICRSTMATWREREPPSDRALEPDRRTTEMNRNPEKCIPLQLVETDPPLCINKHRKDREKKRSFVEKFHASSTTARCPPTQLVTRNREGHGNERINGA